MSGRGPRVLLVSWDSADWKIISPLMDQGCLPALERLVNNGVSGTLSSFPPLVAPMLSASLVTGKTAGKHGVLGYTDRSRSAKAIWNILSERRIDASVAGWYDGHPAEDVSGVSVSPQFALIPSGAPREWPLAEEYVHPFDLREVLGDLRVHPADLDARALLPFVPRAAEIEQWRDDRLARIAGGIAVAASMHNAVTWIMEHRDWDFLAANYGSLGYFSRLFMRYHPPQMAGIPQRDFDLYREVVEGIYRFHDMMLGRLIALAGADATIILVSDHGYKSGALRPKPGEASFNNVAAWQRDFGILCMQGPGIRRDELLHGASLLDIAPTILTLFGLPVGRDMDGKVLVDAFEIPPALAFLPSWEDEAQQPEAGAANEKLAREFAAFGDVEAAGLAGMDAEDRQFNLACAHLGIGRAAEALPILETLAEAAPEDTRYPRPLVQAYLAAGKRAEAKRMITSLLNGHEPRPWMHYFLGIILLQEKDSEGALAALEQAEGSGVGASGLHVCVGEAYLSQCKWDAAERNFAKALAVDPDTPEAHLGLSQLRFRQRRYAEAVECALQAVGLQYRLPQGHFQIGRGLARLGDRERAATAFATALSMAPGMRRAQRYLGLVSRSAGHG